MNSLPPNWVRAAIGILCDLKNGRAFKPAEWSKDGLPIVRIQNLNNASAPFNRFNGAYDKKHHLMGGELLFAWSGTPGTSFGAHVWRGGEALLNQHIFRVDFDAALLDRRFFRHAINQKLTELIGVAHGGAGLQHVTKGVFEGTEVDLPPREEQKRIADKLDTVLTRVDAVNARLARVAPILKRFRQSVLAAATSGRLTEDWREAQASHVVNAKTELEKILKTQLGRLRVRGEAARVSPGDLYELPVSWTWVLNHQLAEDDSNAICAGPFGTIFKAKDFREEGVPIIFLRHIGEGHYLTHKPGFMAAEVWREHHQPYSVFGGELLVTKLGDPPGTACLYPEGIGAAMVTPDVMKMNVNLSAADSRYLMHFFNSPNSKKIVEALCFGVTRLRIDLSMFKTFPVPLPPRREQAEIVRRVETLFAFADRLEARLKAAQTATERLTPALLAKAFRGELVPQDPNDEPASELLKRLAATNAAPYTPKRRGRAPKAA